MFWGSKFGQALGPLGWLAVGVVAGMAASPYLRKGTRRLAVLATCGVLNIADEAKKMAVEAKKVANDARGQLDKLVVEARTVAHDDPAPAK